MKIVIKKKHFYYTLTLIQIEINYQGLKKKVFVSDYITRKTGVGRSGKNFFLHFFYFEKFVSDKLQANLESVGVSVIFFFRHQYELSRDL